MAYRYRAWDGTQDIEPLTPEQVLESLSDDLLAGKIDQVLDRVLHRGLDGPDDTALEGLDDLRDQIRAERQAVQQALANDETLRRLAEELMSSGAGGTDRLDPETSKLFEALAAHRDSTDRLLRLLDHDARNVIEQALSEIQDRNTGVGGQMNVTGPTTFGGSIRDLLERLDGLDELERRIRSVRHVSDVADVDTDRIRALLGDGAANRFERLSASLRLFAESGYVQGQAGKHELSARALQHIGDELLNGTLARLTGRQPGDRPESGRGGSHEPAGTTRDYAFGDPFALDLSQTLLRAVRRQPGTPVAVRPSDFVIAEREDTSRAATVLAIDLSRSMGDRGYLISAKKLALQLTTLIRSRFPRDRLLLIGFSETARSLGPQDLPQLTWDRFSYGTNIQDALRLARNVLGAHRGVQRNVILLTDGEPTAHRDPTGKVHFGHPPFPETLTLTYAEAEWLRRDGIMLYVCVLSSQFQVVRFARQLAGRAAGELIVTSPDDLSSAVIVRYGHRRT